ncbi:MAG: hypothetical protein IPM30_05860 [Burkholderiales bacterium]|jgi:hypothetical protein|nr:hypothetical protein [Burkholderiales bacterium]
MDPSPSAIEVAAVRWEQWIGAALRAEHFRALTEASRASRRRSAPARSRPRARPGLLWLLAASLAGYWLLG